MVENETYAQVWDRDPKACQTLYFRFRGYALKKFKGWLSPNDADDVAQDALSYLMTQPVSRYPDPKGVGFLIIKRHAMEEYSKRESRKFRLPPVARSSEEADSLTREEESKLRALVGNPESSDWDTFDLLALNSRGASSSSLAVLSGLDSLEVSRRLWRARRRAFERRDEWREYQSCCA